MPYNDLVIPVIMETTLNMNTAAGLAKVKAKCLKCCCGKNGVGTISYDGDCKTIIQRI